MRVQKTFVKAKEIIVEQILGQGKGKHTSR